MNQPLPLVSIIMPAYNASQYIAESIQSVLSQTYSEFELIIINDASTDNTFDIAHSFELESERVFLISLTKNLGVSESRNIGLKCASGRFVAFLDADDLWYPNKLHIQIDFMCKADVLVSCSSYDVIQDDGTYVGTRIAKKNISYNDMLTTNYIGMLTGVYDRNAIKPIFMKNIGHEDYVFWLEILQASLGAKGIEMPLAKYRLTKNSLSSNFIKSASWQWVIYRDQLNFSMVTSVFYFILYVFNAIKKRA
jgi:glycosyltransferase involved in cell wall biosynthesis